MYTKLGTLISRAWLAVVLAWIALTVGLSFVAPSWDSVTNDGDLAYLPARMTSVRGEARLADAFPENQVKSQLVIVLERSDDKLGEADLDLADELAARLGPGNNLDLPVVAVRCPSTEVVGRKLVSTDEHAALVVLYLSNEFMATANIGVLDTVKAALDETRASSDYPQGLRLGITGSAAVGGDMLASARDSIRNTELATVALVCVILLVVYRAPLLVVIPLATIAVSVAVALDLVALLTTAHQLNGLEWLDFKVFKTTKIFIVVILFGAGTDFCLFLISRYKEELERGLAEREAVASALGNVGEAIAGSALTTIFGLGMMVFASFGKFRNSGPAIALCLAVALVACLTLAPAMLRVFGRWVFWPGVVRNRAGSATTTIESNAVVINESPNRFWDWASRQIVARPGLILVASVLLLAPLAYAGRDVPISYDLLSELRSDCASVRGTRLLREHFAAGETGPITIVLYKPEFDFDSEEGKRLLRTLTLDLYAIDPQGISAVRSLIEPLGDKPQKSGLTLQGFIRRTAKEHPRTRERYVAQSGPLAGQVTRLDVVSRYDPFSPEAAALVTRIDERLQSLASGKSAPGALDLSGCEFDFVGTTAATRDLKAVTESDQRLIQRLVVIAVYGILLVLLRQPLVCGYLIVSVLFSYFVTIGATELFFAWLYPDFDGLDWKVPLFLFVILIAVGEDYNIYLLTRVVEEQRTRGATEGLRVAVERTGGIITSCGIIMAGTFISMMTGTLRGMLEMGFALSLGVVLDTVVVRPVLVPAFLAILYRWRGARTAVNSPAEGAATPSPPVSREIRAGSASRA